jgi:hypothetical protein
VVCQQQPHRVATRRQLERHFRLASTEITVLIVCRKRVVINHVVWRNIDQQMVVAGIGLLDTRLSDPDAATRRPR